MWTRINDYYLEDLVPGYTTANVEGRGVLAPALSALEVSGRDGNVVRSKRIPSRSLTVHYRLVGSDSVEFLERQEALSTALPTEEADIYFDDQNWHYFGQLSAATNAPYNQRQGFGSYTLYCSDPYKYSDVFQLEGLSVSPICHSALSMRVEGIKVTFGSSQAGYTLSNESTGRRIILLGDFEVGQELEIYPDKGVLTLNGANAMERLDFTRSDWGEFEIFSGNEISSPQPMALSLRERAR